MSCDMTSALISWLKLTGEIDRGVTSFIEIDNLQLMLNSYYRLFNTSPKTTDHTFQVRKVVRWLHEHVPAIYVGDTRVPNVQVEPVLKCDPEELEKLTKLFLFCKSNDETEFQDLFSKLDQSERDILNTLLSENANSPNASKKDNYYFNLALQCREIASLAILNDKFDLEKENLLLEFQKKEQELPKILNDFECELIEKENFLSTSLNPIQLEINDLKAKVEELKRDLPPLLSYDRYSIESKVSSLASNIENLKKRTSKMKENTKSLNSMRELKENDKTADNLRVELNMKIKSAENAGNRLEKQRENFQKASLKNSQWKIKKEELNKIIEENKKELINERENGEIVKKIEKLKRLNVSKMRLISDVEHMKITLLKLRQVSTMYI